MKRRRAIAVVVGVAFLAGIVVAVCLWRRPEVLPIEQALYDRVHVGMTEAEVSAAIPYSPGDHCGTYTYGTGGPLREGELPMGIGWDSHPDGSLTGIHPATGRPVHGKWWLGRQGYLVIFFDEDGRVIERRYYLGFPENFIQYTGRRYGLW